MLFTQWLKGLVVRSLASRQRRSYRDRGVKRLFSQATSPTSGIAAASGGVPTSDLHTIIERLEDRALLSGITVTPTSGLVTTEAGGTAMFTVVLKSQPTAMNLIPHSSTNSRRTDSLIVPLWHRRDFLLRHH